MFIDNTDKLGLNLLTDNLLCSKDNTNLIRD